MKHQFFLSPLFFIATTCFLVSCSLDSSDVSDSSVSPNTDGVNNSAALTQQSQSEEKTHLIPQQAGRTAFIDSVTGELTSEPNSRQQQQLATQQLQSQRQTLVIEQRMSNGAIKATVPQRYHSHLQATVNQNGQFRVRHQKAPLFSEVNNEQQ